MLGGFLGVLCGVPAWDGDTQGELHRCLRDTAGSGAELEFPSLICSSEWDPGSEERWLGQAMGGTGTGKEKSGLLMGSGHKG